MNQSVKPPKILFVRPKSAGSVRSRSQISTSLASASRSSGRQPSTLYAPPIILTGAAAPQPVRPSNPGRRPSSAVGSRRYFTATSVAALPLAKGHDMNGPCLWEQDEEDPETASDVDSGNIYRVVVARKEAEETAQQLVSRIAHFRSQEERALREMQTMRNRLEATLTKTLTLSEANQTLNSMAVAAHPLNLQGRNTMAPYLNTNSKQTKVPHSERRPRLRIPHSREQLEFLAKQKRALELHRLEAVRQEKERRKVALAEQKTKEAEQEQKRRCRKERIRAEEQQTIELRLEKQRQMREAVRKQHFQRLATERQRQHEALNLIAIMEEEERNLRLRLEALHFHREYMNQDLCGSLPAATRRDRIDEDTACIPRMIP